MGVELGGEPLERRLGDARHDVEDVVLENRRHELALLAPGVPVGRHDARAEDADELLERPLQVLLVDGEARLVDALQRLPVRRADAQALGDAETEQRGLALASPAREDVPWAQGVEPAGPQPLG